MSEHTEETNPRSEFKYIQAKLTKEEYKEINLWLLQNDISEKGNWFKQILLRTVREYEPVQGDARLHASQDNDGFDIFR